MTTTAPVVHLDGVMKAYPGPPPLVAVQPLTLRVPSGEFLALMGASGSGKSTLLNLIGLLDPPTSGRVWFEDRDATTIGDAARTQLRGRRIGFVFQAFHLIPYRSAIENVEMSLLYSGTSHRDRKDRAMDALASVGLDHRAHAVPTQLSGGERQRVAIARALAVEPALVICDEPTGNLDSTNSAGVMNLLDQLNRAGTTIIIATHDPDVARHASRLIRMQDGRMLSG